MFTGKVKWSTFNILHSICVCVCVNAPDVGAGSQALQEEQQELFTVKAPLQLRRVPTLKK